MHWNIIFLQLKKFEKWVWGALRLSLSYSISLTAEIQWPRNGKGRSSSSSSTTLLTARYSSPFTNFDTRQILCINNCCASGQHIPDQTTKSHYLQCHQSHSACHRLFSRIPNDSHNFGLTNPVSSINFPILPQLSEAQHGFVLINYALAGWSCQSYKQVMYAALSSCSDQAWIRAGVMSQLPDILKQIRWGKGGEKDNKENAWQPSSKLHCPGRQ